MLLLRAVARIGPYLTAYDYCGTGTHEDDEVTLALLTKVVDIARAVGKFDETVLFRGDDANVSALQGYLDCYYIDVWVFLIRFSRRSSSSISVMSLGLWIALDATSVDFGARSRRQVSVRPSRSCLN